VELATPIEITYVETLRYADGVFEWVFPMVVGPRYIPGGGSAPAPMTPGQDTPEVPDGSKITPPVTPKGTRAGHDISLTVHLETGMELRDLASTLHEVTVEQTGPGRATVTLKNQAEIPNKDFILRYRLAGDEIADAFLVHQDERGRFFTLVLQPPRRVVPEKLVPRELIFVLDSSGSMSGFPIEKAKELMSKLIDTMQPADTFNLITFSGETRILWDQPRPNTAENRAEMQALLASLKGGGGTEMMKAIDAALRPRMGGVPLTVQQLRALPADGREVSVRVPAHGWVIERREAQFVEFGYIPSDSGDRIPIRMASMHWRAAPGSTETTLYGRWTSKDGQALFDITNYSYPADFQKGPIRVVCFMTDGFVGNDMAIIDAIKKYAGTTRVFSFGIGNSVNRFLLDNMARAGRGEVEYVTLNHRQDAGATQSQQQADAAMERFHERVLAPVLTDIAIDWGTLPVADVYPTQIPDLFSAKPIMIHGRLTGPAEGTIVLRGNTGAGPYEEPIEVRWPQAPPDHAALASLWARAKVAELMMQDYAGLQSGQFPDELKKQVTALGIEFRLMTQFTSFVAVEEMTVTVGGEPVKIAVPVEMPEGVSYEGVFGLEHSAGASGLMLSGQAAGKRQPYFGPAGPSAGPPIMSGAAPRSGGFGVGDASGNAPARTGAKPPAGERKELARERGYRAGIYADSAATTQPLTTQEIVRAKLAEPLRDLAAKVEKEGREGTLAIGKLKVAAWRVDVMVFLSDASEKTLEALKKLGFEQTGESKAVKLLVGTIDVRKLEELAVLDAVLSVKPVVAP
jgi:hypothetical protein